MDKLGYSGRRLSVHLKDNAVVVSVLDVKRERVEFELPMAQASIMSQNILQLLARRRRLREEQMNHPQTLSISEAAKVVGVSRQRMHKIIQHYKLPTVPAMGRSRRIATSVAKEFAAMDLATRRSMLTCE